ncbi:Ribosomal protein S13 [Mycena indigotica]|uniref:Ribosomal protein S13 n=1 Tax=Mycena indigotica TaxID=2126181 RepID=A0A8H6SE39_9AGAR|nr:Ribosomal protein S13 [Mycena indigotica]KAF7297263.1 Ribosomal protein S13 [Mycena indigotica]
MSTTANCVVSRISEFGFAHHYRHQHQAFLKTTSKLVRSSKFPVLSTKYTPASIMGRMHAPGKGISSSALPYRRAPPTWLKTTPEEVVEHIVKLARKGLTPSQIGVTLRDSHGIPQVRFLTGNKILRILKSQGLGPSIPEDLWHLVKKAVAVRKHLEVNRKDKDSKFRLILIESRIHRLARYYKTKQQIPPTFKYDSATASTLVA